MSKDELLTKLGIDHPIIQAPMAGGTDTPELVAAVSNAGGLGSVGAAYLSPVQIVEAIKKIRTLTGKPFNVNLFAGGYDDTENDKDAQPMLSLLTSIHQELGLPPPVLPSVSRDPFPEQFETVLEAHPSVFSFTFGIPKHEAIEHLKSRKIAVLGTATSLKEALMLDEAGVDAIVAQGAEAGAHRGTFGEPFEKAMVPTIDLVRGITQEVSVPIIASGGMMDGGEIAISMSAGASAAQLGTAFLTCSESGASQAHKRAVLEAKTDTTVITRAFSGRPARGIANRFTSKLEGRDDLILPFPLQNVLTRPMRNAAAKRGDARYLSLWAGKGAAKARSMPAGELVRLLVREMEN